jgi:fructose-1,6-bisphosphatase/inositol monophosphatase family enzyme
MTYFDREAVAKDMRCAVSEAIRKIREYVVCFDARTKSVAYKETDTVTDADFAAQRNYVAWVQKGWPDFGILAEEDDLKIEGNPYFTIDPLDGTKAFVRRSSQGIGTMISLVDGNDIIAVYVGDVMTGEIYGYGPDDTPVTRWTYGSSVELCIDSDRSLSEQYAVLRERPSDYHPIVQKMLSRETPLVKNIEVLSGSIGLTYAKLWKGEVGMVVLPSSYDTPWDSNPIYGINRALGFVDYLIHGKQGTLIHCKYKPVTEITQVGERITVHHSRLPEIRRWLSNTLSVNPYGLGLVAPGTSDESETKD